MGEIFELHMHNHARSSNIIATLQRDKTLDRCIELFNVS